MQEFEDYLKAEGVGDKTTEQIILPVIKRLPPATDLKLIRPNKSISPFKHACRPQLDHRPKGLVALLWTGGFQDSGTAFSRRQSGRN